MKSDWNRNSVCVTAQKILIEICTHGPCTAWFLPMPFSFTFQSVHCNTAVGLLGISITFFFCQILYLSFRLYFPVFRFGFLFSLAFASSFTMFSVFHHCYLLCLTMWITIYFPCFFCSVRFCLGWFHSMLVHFFCRIHFYFWSLDEGKLPHQK